MEIRAEILKNYYKRSRNERNGFLLSSVTLSLFLSLSSTRFVSIEEPPIYVYTFKSFHTPSTCSIHVRFSIRNRVIWSIAAQVHFVFIVFNMILNDELSISWLRNLISKTDSFKRETLWKRIVPVLIDDQGTQVNKRFSIWFVVYVPLLTRFIAMFSLAINQFLQKCFYRSPFGCDYTLAVSITMTDVFGIRMTDVYRPYVYSRLVNSIFSTLRWTPRAWNIFFILHLIYRNSFYRVHFTM